MADDRGEEGSGPELRFEEALAKLDEVVARMEGGDVGLEEAVWLFERGQEYLAICQSRLAATQERIDELTADEPTDRASEHGPL